MQRGSALTLLLVFVLLISIGIGVFLVQFSRTKTKTEAFVPEKVQTVKPSAPVKNIQKREKSGLEFELPVEFIVKEETEKEYFKRVYGDIRKNFNYYILYSPPEVLDIFYVLGEEETNPDKAVLSFWLFRNPEELDPEAFYSKYWYYPFVWGDFSERKNAVAPENIELIGGKEGKSNIITYRDGKPKFIYIPINNKKLMVQISLPTEKNQIGQEMLQTLKFE